jgi:hypothetical protein
MTSVIQASEAIAGTGGRGNARAERAAHYRRYAAEFQILADDEQDKSRRAQLAKLARAYAKLAARVQAEP